MNYSKLCALAAGSALAACSAIADEPLVVAEGRPRMVLAPMMIFAPTPTSPPIVVPSPAPHGLARTVAEIEQQTAELAAIAAEIRAGR